MIYFPSYLYFIFASIYQFNMLKFNKIILHAKQQQGNKLIEKKIFLPVIENAEEFESIIMGFLKRDFSL